MRTKNRYSCLPGIQVLTSLFFFLMLISYSVETFAQALTGAVQTQLYYPLLRGKQVGIVANNASDVQGINIVDLLVKEGFLVKRIFSPEHGFRMNAEAGAHIGNDIDSATGIPVVSLYGNHMKPSATDLDGIDAVVFDIQDVGVRFYTYISTLTYVMEACAENKIPLILLDRPNPNGFYIDGPVLEKRQSSFVGLHPVPVVYGMTIGEYGRMVNGERWLKAGVKCRLQVIPLSNYRHQTRYDIPVRPSPNLTNRNAVYLYPSLCFFEGTAISVGRGTSSPFEVFGHPEMKIGSFTFTPESIPGVSVHPPCEGNLCRGVDLRGYTQENPDGPQKINLEWLLSAYRDWGGRPGFFNGYFNKLAGNELLQQQIIQGKTEKEIRESWKPGIERFKKIRAKYLLY
jgi:uncharacterized protein YbbC (DUF1343 family)